MIRVLSQPEPSEFEEQVRRPGRAALLELVGDPTAPKRTGPRRARVADRIADIPPDKLPDLWTRSLPELRKAYRNVCAYLGMKIHGATGAATIDHFAPKSKHQELAYEWSNYRLAAKQVNANKGWHEDVFDPFEIEDGWFALRVGSFEVVPADSLDAPTRVKVEATIQRLKLNEPTFRDARQEYHDRYQCHAEPVGAHPREALPFAWPRRGGWRLWRPSMAQFFS